MIIVLFSLSLLLLAACGDGIPSSASPSATVLDKGASFAGTLQGQVVDVLTGRPVGGASLQALGTGVLSASDGSFAFEGHLAGSVPLIVEAEGYWTRETRAQPGRDPVILTLLPAGDHFDLEFFDHVFRELGEAGTHPWTSEPTFEIWQSAYRCLSPTETGACDELEATSEPASSEFLRLAREVIAGDAPLYSGGKIQGTRRLAFGHEPGRRLLRDDFLQTGKVSVVLVERDDDFSWAFTQFHQSGKMITASIQMNRRHQSFRGIYSHELAHALGFRHPRGLDAVPRESIMRADHGSEPTANDRLHGRILYLRPPNSRTPDRDPDAFVLHGRAVATGAIVTRAER